MACGASTSPGFGIVRAEEVEDVGFPQAHGTVRQSLLVDQKREGDASFFPEQERVGPVAKAHRSQVRALLFEGRLVVAQLSDVLTAEDSTIVAQKHEDGGLLPPKGTQTQLSSVGVGQNDAGERLAEGTGHLTGKYT